MRTIQCSNGETCFSEECVKASMCMHQDEIHVSEHQRADLAGIDTVRLDWLERNRLIASIVWRYVDGTFTLRMAVDFAMKQENFSGSIMRDEWLRVCGLQPKITAFACPPKCEHVMDGPTVEDGNVTSVTCSKCGARAFDVDMMEAP